MTKPNVWKSLLEMYRLGVLPIGYIRGEFVIYCQESGAERKRPKKVTRLNPEVTQ